MLNNRFSVPIWINSVDEKYHRYFKYLSEYVLFLKDKDTENSSHDRLQHNRSGLYTTYHSKKQNKLLVDKECEYLREIITEQVHEYFKSMDFDFDKNKFSIVSLFANVISKGGYHSNHIHEQTPFAGVIYLQVTEDSSPLYVLSPMVQQTSCIPITTFHKNGPTQFEQAIKLPPKVGDVVMFPAYVFHEVTPSAVDEDRISVGFNIQIEAK
jgi:uncharacterized protein (TIGR02466 family)